MGEHMNANKWVKENWTVGQYTPTENFKAITNHSCVCRKDNMDLIAVVGPAECLESQKQADLITAAPELLEALDRFVKYTRVRTMELASLQEYANLTVLVGLADDAIAKAKKNY